jgi:hypothetical protein
MPRRAARADWAGAVLSCGSESCRKRVLNPRRLFPNFFAAPTSFWTQLRPHRAAFRRLAPRGRALSADGRERLRWAVAEGGFIVEHRYGSREVSTWHDFRLLESNSPRTHARRGCWATRDNERCRQCRKASIAARKGARSPVAPLRGLEVRLAGGRAPRERGERVARTAPSDGRGSAGAPEAAGRDRDHDDRSRDHFTRIAVDIHLCEPVAEHAEHQHAEQRENTRRRPFSSIRRW